MPKLLAALLLTLILQACKALEAAQQDQAALILNPDEAAIEELRQTIQKAISDRSVTIAKTAFTTSYRLLIVRKKHLGPDGLPIQTRVDEPPRIFELRYFSGNCYLLDTLKKTRYPLKQTSCKPGAELSE